MPNRRGREVAASAAFKPQGLLPDGLLPVSRPAGELGDEITRAGHMAAESFGRYANEAAQLEGERAGKIAGLDLGFRPTGSTTLAGRAYDAAATRTYQDNLDASLREDMQKVFEANKSDPKALKAGYDVMLSEYEGQHVFDEIRGAFRASFQRMRLPYENKALSNLEADTKDRARATLLGNIEASQSNVARAAAVDPRNPNTARLVETEIGRLDTLLDAAVADDTISAEAAQTLKVKNRNTVTQRAVLAEAESLASADAIATYRDNVRKAYGAGKLKSLSAAGYDELDSRLEAIQRSKRTEGNQAETLLKKNVDDYVQRVVDGYSVSGEEWTRFASSEGARSAKGQQILAAGTAQLTIANAIKNRSIVDSERMVAGLRAELNTSGAVNEGQADLVTFAEKVVKEQRTALNTDQLGLAARKQIVPAVAPLDF